MNLSFLNAELDRTFARMLSQAPTFRSQLPRTLAPGVTITSRTYIAPAGSGFTVTIQLQSPAGITRRCRTHGPMIDATHRDAAWNLAEVRAFEDAIIRHAYSSLDDTARAAFADTFAGVLSLRRENTPAMDRTAYLAAERLETPPSMQARAAELTALKAMFLFYIAP